MNPLYVVTDIEVDGPNPGENSMLSFASVAVDSDCKEFDEFQAVLEPLDGAKSDPVTMAWFRSQPEALAAATHNPKPAAEVISRYINWVRGLPGDPIFVAHPLAFDGICIDYYLRIFSDIRILKGPWVGERLFFSGGLCLQSFAAGKLGWPIWECRADNFPTEWFGENPHNHVAIDDARGNANLLINLMSGIPPRMSPRARPRRAPRPPRVRR